MMTPEQAWDAVLSIQTDIERIVSQAVRAGRVRVDYTATDGMSYCVELLVASREPIRDVAAYVLASLRRELLFDLTHVTDALDRATLQGATVAINEQVDDDGESEETAKPAKRAEISASTLENRAGDVADRVVDFRGVEGLTALENRVARLKIAGKTNQWIAAATGLSLRQVGPMIGKVAAKIRRTK